MRVLCHKHVNREEFEIAEAKDILGLSRKLMIPFLEKLDRLDLTIRVENKRVWK
jgi:selenocysteine-specific elongation factor